MKVYFIILVIVSFAYSAPSNDQQFAVDNSWDQLIELLRQLIKEGYPTVGIPVMDPYQLDFMKMELREGFFKISANISDGTFTGLGDFQINKFDLSIADLMLDFDVYFPKLSFFAEYYEMEGDIIETFPLAGQGIFHFEVYDFNVGSKVFLKQSADKQSVLIERFESPGFSVTKILSTTEYDNNFDGILNAMIEDLLAGYLNRFNKYIAATICDHYIDRLNSILANLRSW